MSAIETISFSVLPITFLASLLFKHLAYPIQKMTEAVRGLTADHQIRTVYPYDELGNLSRVIDTIVTQVRKKFAEVSEDREYLQTVLKGSPRVFSSSMKKSESR